MSPDTLINVNDYLNMAVTLVSIVVLTPLYSEARKLLYDLLYM